MRPFDKHTLSQTNRADTSAFPLKKGDTRWQLVQRALFISTVVASVIAYYWYATPIFGIILETDTYFMSRGMVVYLLYALGYTFWNIIRVSHELSLVRKYIGQPTKRDSLLSLRSQENTLIHEACQALAATPHDRHHTEIIDIVRDKLDERVARVSLYGNTMIIFGFLGTLAGFVLALEAANFTALFADSTSAGKILDSIKANMMIAIGTSVVGAIGKIWLTKLGIILEEGVRHLAINIVKMEIGDDTKP